MKFLNMTIICSCLVPLLSIAKGTVEIIASEEMKLETIQLKNFNCTGVASEINQEKLAGDYYVSLVIKDPVFKKLEKVQVRDVNLLNLDEVVKKYNERLVELFPALKHTNWYYDKDSNSLALVIPKPQSGLPPAEVITAKVEEDKAEEFYRQWEKGSIEVLRQELSEGKEIMNKICKEVDTLEIIYLAQKSFQLLD